MISGYMQRASASTGKAPRTGRYSGSYPVGRWCIKIVRFAWPLNLEPYLIRTEIGMPRPVILLSALQAILASIF
jgi:hypothetical protein